MLLSPLDWALMETWKDAGIPLEAVLRGIDATFEKWERRPQRFRKVNSLAYCAQEILATAAEMQEAAVGASRGKQQPAGLEPTEVSRFLLANAEQLESTELPASVQGLAREAANTLRTLAEAVGAGAASSRLPSGTPASATQPSQPALVSMEELERRLTVAEEKLFAALLAATADDALLQVRADADRDLAPYRRKMTAPQIDQLHKQYVHKRLLDQYHIPRLSLFYM